MAEVWPIRNLKFGRSGTLAQSINMWAKFGLSGTRFACGSLWPFRNQSLALSEPKFGPFGTQRRF